MPSTKTPKTKAKKPKVKKAAPEFVCGYCKKDFVREKSLLVHMCENKRRHMCIEDRPNKVGFMVFQRLYKNNRTGKAKTYSEFATSSLYKGLVGFGRYINDINAIQPADFIDFLLKGEVPLDKWQSPVVYQTYVRELAKKETPTKAVERNFLLMQQWALDTGEEWTDFFRKIAPTQAVAWIISGRISPWVLYLAPSAAELLVRFDEGQIDLIQTTIEPKFWAIKIKVNAEEVAIIKDQLGLAGL